MLQADKLIHSYSTRSSYSTREWVSVTAHVIAKLGDALGSRVHHELQLESYVDDGVRMDVSCLPMAPNALEFRYKGIVASNIRDGKLCFCATVFIYCNEEKLVTVGGESFVDLEYRCGDGEGGRWFVSGWFKDEYAEYGEFDQM